MSTELTEQLEIRFDIHFKNQKLLTEAFTQGNYLNEHPEEVAQGARDYQRLEFLGDSVMQLAVANFLFNFHNDWSEGQLTEMRIAMVQTKSFAHFSRRAGFDKFIRMGRGEEKSGARNRDSLLEDIFEAFVGALYLDQGMDAVNSFLNKTLFAEADGNFFNQFIDYKSKLQETLQKSGPVKIEYVKTNEKENVDHSMHFEVEVRIDGQVFGNGSGNSIKNAEKVAAQSALLELEKFS